MHMAITVVIMAFFVLYSQRQGKGAYTVDTIKSARPLPEWYAVCSKEGKKVYTVPADGGAGAVECVVVGGKRVVDTGSLAKVRREWGERGSTPPSGDSTAVTGAPDAVKKKGIKIVYLPPGHSLTPGFTDAHAHPLEYGYSRRLPLAGTKSIDEIIAKVEAYVAARGGKIPDGEWIVGMGWDQTKWPVKEFPTAVSRS